MIFLSSRSSISYGNKILLSLQMQMQYVFQLFCEVRRAHEDETKKWGSIFAVADTTG
jgi:hypothetical protein